jgi:hypothetical protein
MTLRFSLPATAFLAILIGTACATTAPPNEKTASTSGAIRAAEEVGATHNPDSALYLQLAKEEFGHARVLTDHKDKDVADRLLTRAQVDAELSLALARNENEKTEAQAAIDNLRKLKESAVQ